MEINENPGVFFAEAECPTCGENVHTKGVLVTELTHKGRPSIPFDMLGDLAFSCDCGANFITAESEILDG